MKELRLQRHSSRWDGVIGSLIGDGFRCETLEQKWRENKTNISCIPEGEYICEMTDSPRFGRVYQVKNVKDRTHVLIHAGNRVRDTQGCILVGNRVTVVDGDTFINASRVTLSSLHDWAGGNPFKLKIE